jgi:hypothetical protein
VLVRSDPTNGDGKFSFIKRVHLIIRFLFLNPISSRNRLNSLWMHSRIGHPIRCVIGTIRNISRYVPCYFTDKFLFSCQLHVKLNYVLNPIYWTCIGDKHSSQDLACRALQDSPSDFCGNTLFGTPSRTRQQQLHHARR